MGLVVSTRMEMHYLSKCPAEQHIVVFPTPGVMAYQH